MCFQVNHNGHLTFNAAWYRYSPQRFPLRGSRDLIAPFWTDLDNTRNGQIYYNQYTNGSVLQQATRDINTYFPSLRFNASWVFVATWYEVAYYYNKWHSKSACFYWRNTWFCCECVFYQLIFLKATHFLQRTTVQAVLISGGSYSFVLMNYGQIAATNRLVQVSVYK